LSATAIEETRAVQTAFPAPREAPSFGAVPTGELGRQSRMAAVLGSPFVARVLLAMDRNLFRARQCAAVLAAWPEDRAEAALAMRLNAGLHFLARSGRDVPLTRLYERQEGDFDRVVGHVLERHDSELAQWLGHPTQTNEVARSAGVMAALKVAGAITAMPFDLMEIGSSAGLNLNLGHYRFTLGGVDCGPQTSPLHIVPGWRGLPPPDFAPRVARARGVDLAPIDLALPASREKLHAYVWADRKTRQHNLDSALEIAALTPPQVEQGDALDWLSVQLAAPPVPGLCRVVINTMVLQYLPRDRRAAILQMLSDAITLAPVEAPIAHVSLEWTAPRDEVRLGLMLKAPSGEVRRYRLAACHPYGDWIDWQMPAA
jgi:hypothetical protein